MTDVFKLSSLQKPGVVRVDLTQKFRLPSSPKNEPPAPGSIQSMYDVSTKSFTRYIVGADFGRQIEGVATSSRIDAHKESLDPAGALISLPIPLLWMHGPEKKDADSKKIFRTFASMKIGEVFSYTRTADDIRIRARFDDSDAGNYAFNLLVQDDSMRSLSVGLDRIEMGGLVDGVKFCKKWRLREISIVSLPANPDCVFRLR